MGCAPFTATFRIVEATPNGFGLVGRAQCACFFLPARSQLTDDSSGRRRGPIRDALAAALVNATSGRVRLPDDDA